MAFRSLSEVLPSAKITERKGPASRENRDPNLMAMVERQRQLKLKYNQMIKAEGARREGHSQSQEDEAQEDEPRGAIELVDISAEKDSSSDRITRKKKPKFVSSALSTERRRMLDAWRNRSLSVVVNSEKRIGIKHASENCDLIRFQTRKLRTRKEIAEAYDKLHGSAKELLKLYLWFSHSSRNTDGGWVSHRQNYIATCLAEKMGRDSFSARSIRRLNRDLHSAGFLITVTSVDRVGDRLTGSIKVKPCVSRHYYYSVILKKKINNFIDCDLDNSSLLCDYIDDRLSSSSSPSSLFIKNKVTDTDISLFGKDLEFHRKLSSVSQGGSEGASMTLKRGGVDKPKGKFVCYCRCGGTIWKNKGNYGYFYACSFNNADEKRCFFWLPERELEEYIRYSKQDFKKESEMINFYSENFGKKDAKDMPAAQGSSLPAPPQIKDEQEEVVKESPLGSCRCGQPLHVVNKGLICSNFFYGCRMSGAVEFKPEDHIGSKIVLGECKCRGQLFIENLKISCSNAPECVRANPSAYRNKQKDFIYIGKGRRCCRECGLELQGDRSKFGSFLSCKNQCISTIKPIANYAEGLCKGKVRVCAGIKPLCETHNGQCGSFLMSNLTFDNGRYEYANYTQLGTRDRELIHKWTEKLRAERLSKIKRFDNDCCQQYKRICSTNCAKFPQRKDSEMDLAPTIDNGCCLTLSNHKSLEQQLCYIAKPKVEGVCCRLCEAFMLQTEQEFGMAYDCLEKHLEFERDFTGTISTFERSFDGYVGALVTLTWKRFSKIISKEERSKLPDLNNIQVVLKLCKMGQYYFDESEPGRTLADLERLKEQHIKNGKKYWLT